MTYYIIRRDEEPRYQLGGGWVSEIDPRGLVTEADKWRLDNAVFITKGSKEFKGARVVAVELREVEEG